MKSYLLYLDTTIIKGGEGEGGEGEGGEEEKNHNWKFKIKRDFCWCGFALHNNISTIQKKKKL